MCPSRHPAGSSHSCRSLVVPFLCACLYLGPPDLGSVPAHWVWGPLLFFCNVCELYLVGNRLSINYPYPSIPCRSTLRLRVVGSTCISAEI